MTERRPMDESHEALLKTALGLQEHANLPEDVIETYWDIERTTRKLFRRGVNDTEMVFVLLFNGRSALKPPVSFLDEGAEAGEIVLAKHRGEWRWGTFKCYKGKQVVVQIDDGSAEDREFDANSVRRATAEEFNKVR